MAKPKIIALYSPAPQSGKSTVAEHLITKGHTLMKFATPLKDMLVMFLMHCGLDLEVARAYVEKPEMKELPLRGPCQGRTTRHLMKTLGEEWGRQQIHPDVWVSIFSLKIEKLPKGSKVVVDDMRYPNEYQAMADLGAKLVRINRPGYEAKDDHPSEGRLDSSHFDISLSNDSDLSSFMGTISKTFG